MSYTHATPHSPKYRSLQDNLRIDMLAKKHDIPVCMVEEYLDANEEQRVEIINKIKSL